MIDIVVGYLVIQMLTFLFDVLSHLLLHLKQLLYHVVLLNKLLNVASDLVYLFVDPLIDTHNVLSFGLPLDLLGDRRKPFISGALHLLNLSANLIEATVIDA